MALVAGEPINPLLIGNGALARCSAVVEPLSSYAHLISIEAHAIEVRRLYELDTARLIQERDFWKSKAQSSKSFFEQPWFVAVTTSALVATGAIAYSTITED